MRLSKDHYAFRAGGVVCFAAVGSCGSRGWRTGAEDVVVLDTYGIDLSGHGAGRCLGGGEDGRDHGSDLPADPAAGGWSGAAGHPLRGGSILLDVLVALSRFPPSGSGDMASGNDRHNQLNLAGLSAGT
jgi:hypothetical protein